jgi:hypothetical protein
MLFAPVSLDNDLAFLPQMGLPSAAAAAPCR